MVSKPKRELRKDATLQWKPLPHKCVLYGDLYTQYDTTIFKIDRRTNQKGNTIYKNDILFPQSTTVDAYSLISPACLNEKIAETSGVFVIRPSKNIDGNFVAYYSKGNEKQRNKLAKKAQGLTIVHLYYQSIKNETILIPSLIEQKKISSLLIKLDYLITLHQRKLIFLKSHRFLMSVLFCYSWEQRKLEELGKIETGNTPATSNLEYYSDTGFLWITPTDITSNITTKTVKYLSDKGEKVARVIPANSTLCTCIASIGKNTFCPIKCAFNQQINALSPNNSNDPYFIFTDSYHWSITMKKGAGGLTFQIVNKTEFSSIKTYIPSKQEQVKIGQLFYKLDSLITLHQRKQL